MEVVSNFCSCVFLLQEGICAKWFLAQLEYQHNRQDTWPFFSIFVLPSLVTMCNPPRSYSFLYSFFRPCLILCLIFLYNTAFLAAFSPCCYFFRSLSSSVLDHSDLLSTSSKNNLAALARGRCHPRLAVTAASLLQLSACPWDFHTSHRCIQQMCPDFVMKLVVALIAFFPILYHKLLVPFLTAAVPCCWSCSFHCSLPRLSRTCSWFAFRHRLVIQQMVAGPPLLSTVLS